MSTSENKYFDLLKKKIVEEMKQSYPEIPGSIADWKGQNIIDFQDDLRIKLHENISEKWFYTHMKSEKTKLPRIDILNFLSKYVGYRNWDVFKLLNKGIKNNLQSDKSNRVFYLVPFFTIIILLIFYLGFNLMYTQVYNFCFYDNYTKEPLKNGVIEISVLSNESPVNYLCDSSGCFSIKTNERVINFVVETPYYHTDTIIRTLNKFNRTENIKLNPDDYALMIHYLSTKNIKDWLKRKNDLDKMFIDEAKIYQVLDGTVGMEIYNKWVFINKLTLPANSLRNIEIIDTQYDGDKISRLRFKQNGEKE